MIFEHFDYIFRFTFTHQTVVYMHAYQVVANRFQQQSSHHGAVDSTGQSQQNLLIAYLTFNQFNLVVDKVRHIPVGFSFASIENERFHISFNRLDIIGKRCQFHFTRCLIMTGGHHWNIHRIDTRIHIDSHAINHIVRSAIDNNALYVGQCFQFFHCDVVRINLTIHS